MAFSPTVEKFTPQEKYFTYATSRNRSSDRNYKLIVKDKCCNHILPFAFMARQVALVSNSLFLLFITYIHVRADERKRAVGGYLCASFDRN